MTIEIVIKDSDTGQTARVTPFGQLVTAPIEYDDTVSVLLNADNIVFNLLTPTTGERIVITGFVISATKDISPSDPADILIYESDAIDSAVSSRSLIEPQLLRATNLPITGINMIVSQGTWVNATTTDSGIVLTVLFYRVPVGQFDE